MIRPFSVFVVRSWQLFCWVLCIYIKVVLNPFGITNPETGNIERGGRRQKETETELDRERKRETINSLTL